MDILEQTKEWITLEDVENGLNPYLDLICENRCGFNIEDCKKEIDTVKKLAPIVKDRYRLTLVDRHPVYNRFKELLEELFELPGHDFGSLKKLLLAQPMLCDEFKENILLTWEENSYKRRNEQSAWKTITYNVGVMEEIIKKNSAEISEVDMRLKELNSPVKRMGHLCKRISETLKSLQYSWESLKISLAQPYPSPLDLRIENERKAKAVIDAAKKAMAERFAMAEKRAMDERKAMAENKPILSPSLIGEHRVYLKYF